MITSVEACRGIAAPITCALLLFGCSNQSRSADTEPAAEPSASAATSPTESSAQHAIVGKAPTANGVPTIVIVKPQTPREFQPQTETPVMDQAQMTFIPGILFVRTGQPVEFWNSDEVLHNINVKESSTREQAFNVAIPTDGKYLHTFKRDGFYGVACDIHPGMSAQILATSTPYVTVTDKEGNFAFHDLQPGAYTVRVQAGTKEIERSIQVDGRTEVNVSDH